MNSKMKSAIEKITLNDATFSNEVIEPTYVNFFYGKNGAGKSTIARTFKVNDEHLQWQAGRASADYDVLVYDTDFINANLRNYGNLAGVFTVNETNIAIQEQVDTLNAERKKMGEEYNGHKAAIDQKVEDKSMLSYAFQALNQETYEDVAVESFDEMYNLLAAILSKGIGLQLKQGLYREYISRQEELSVMRGKINMPGTIKNRLAHKRVLTCDFDELSENNLLNQILKTTVTLLLRNGKVQAKYKDDLKKKMLYFSNVEIIEPTGIKWSSIRFQRNNQTYRMLVSICQLIIEGMLITTDSGDYRLASFVDEQRMCRLYEKFILEYYSRHYPELSVSASQIPWSLDDGIGTMLPVMQSDIHLQRGNTVLIIDAKYYSHTTQSQFDKHTIHSNNLYQIFTYVKNRSYQFGEEKNTVSGMLLYAKTEEEIQPDNVYQMHGSQISVKTLDLNQPFAEIANQMDRIVESHFSGLTKTY